VTSAHDRDIAQRGKIAGKVESLELAVQRFECGEGQRQGPSRDRCWIDNIKGKQLLHHRGAIARQQCGERGANARNHGYLVDQGRACRFIFFDRDGHWVDQQALGNLGQRAASLSSTRQSTRQHKRTPRMGHHPDGFAICEVIDQRPQVCRATGNPMTVHWGLPDPAAAKGSEAQMRQEFANCLELTTRRINALCNLPMADLDKQTLWARLEAIGRT